MNKIITGTNGKTGRVIGNSYKAYNGEDYFRVCWSDGTYNDIPATDIKKDWFIDEATACEWYERNKRGDGANTIAWEEGYGDNPAVIDMAIDCYASTR